jgi:hypothetical protein
MKRYSDLSIIEKINFKSYCIHYRITHFKINGFVPYHFGLMSVDGIVMNLLLHKFEFDRTYYCMHK